MTIDDKIRDERLQYYINSSTANKGQSMVNYRQSLVSDRPYSSCKDHCDQWLFQEIYFH